MNDIHSRKTKLFKIYNEKYPYTFPFNIFLCIVSRFLTSKLGPLENEKSFLLIK